MMDMAADLAAERARAAEKRARAHLEARARMLLRGHRGADRLELMHLAAEHYPALTGPQREEVADVAQEIQSREREPAPPAEVTDPLSTWRQTLPEPMPRPERYAPEPKEAEVGRAPHASPEKQAEIREHIRGRLKDEPLLSTATIREDVESALGVPISEATVKRHYAGPLRRELGIVHPQNSEVVTRAKVNGKPRPKPTKAKPAASNGNGTHDPIPGTRNRIAEAAADLAFSEAVHPQLEEIRSLRATYETGQYVRIEEEDGTWCLRLMLDFSTRGEALNALTGILGIVE